MESGKISFGFLLFLLILFSFVGGAAWLGFSNTKTGVPLIDDSISKLQAYLPQTEQTDSSVTQRAPHDHDHDHDHGDDTHTHDDSEMTESSDIPGKQGQVFQKPISPVLGERSVGDPNAPIQIREFYSLTCNHCAAFHESTYQQLKTDYIETGKVHFIFEEFPLNGPALYGSMIARCMPEDRYEGFVSMLLKNQDQWAFGGDFKGALKQNAALVGMSEEDFETCYNNRDLQTAIAKNIQVSSDTWKISSTPSFIFNNGQRIMSGVNSLQDFEKVMAFLNGETMPISQTPELPVIETPVLETPSFETPSLETPSFETPSFEAQVFEENIFEEEAPISPEVPPSPGVPPTPLEDTSIDINDLFQP